MSEETTEITPAADASVAEAPQEEVATPGSLAELERKTKVRGRVERLELYGAFIDIGLETSALVHISKLAPGHVNRVSDVLSVGDEVEVWIDRVDPEQNQIMVTMVEPLGVEWQDLKEGQTYTGRVTRLENFGAFVDIGAEREGLVHISELSHDYVKTPSEVVKVGDEVQVQVLGFSRRKRRIDLSMKALLDQPEQQYAAPDLTEYDDVDDDQELPTAMEIAMRRAMGTEGENGKRGKKGRRDRNRKRAQEDILSRTLKYRD